MKRILSVLSTAAFSTTVMVTVMAMSASLAQAAPYSGRLPPAKLQQFSRDLIPSSAQDFFRAGQNHLEREIVLLTRPRSLLNENLLNVRQGAQPQQESPARSISSPRTQLRRGQ